MIRSLIKSAFDSRVYVQNAIYYYHVAVMLHDNRLFCFAMKTTFNAIARRLNQKKETDKESVDLNEETLDLKKKKNQDTAVVLG